MGIREADNDGIEHYFDPNKGARGMRGAEIYIVPCDVCGNMMKTLNYGHNRKFICDRCKDRRERHKQEVETAWFEVIEEKGERRFNQALDKIQAQVDDFSKYDKAVKAARKAQDKYGSVPEAMVAVELLKLGYRIIPQQKVGKYRVDFYLPKEKMVVEVDGELYHRDNFRGDREATIQLSLGLDLTIVHVPAEWISKNIRKLKKVIEKSRNQDT